MNHYYGIEAADLTLPEFLAALNAMNYVHEELKPKTEAEIAARMAAQIAAQAAAQRKLKEAP